MSTFHVLLILGYVLVAVVGLRDKTPSLRGETPSLRDSKASQGNKVKAYQLHQVESERAESEESERDESEVDQLWNINVGHEHKVVPALDPDQDEDFVRDDQQMNGYAPIFMYEDIMNTENELWHGSRDLLAARRVLEGDISRQNVESMKAEKALKTEERARQNYIGKVVETGIGRTQSEQLHVTMDHFDHHRSRIQSAASTASKSLESTDVMAGIMAAKMLAGNVTAEMEMIRNEYQDALKEAEKRTELANISMVVAKVNFTHARATLAENKRSSENATERVSADAQDAVHGAEKSVKEMGKIFFHLREGVSKFKADNSTYPESAATPVHTASLGLVSLIACYALMG